MERRAGANLTSHASSKRPQRVLNLLLSPHYFGGTYEKLLNRRSAVIR